MFRNIAKTKQLSNNSNGGLINTVSTRRLVSTYSDEELSRVLTKTICKTGWQKYEFTKIC